MGPDYAELQRLLDDVEIYGAGEPVGRSEIVRVDPDATVLTIDYADVKPIRGKRVCAVLFVLPDEG